MLSAPFLLRDTIVSRLGWTRPRTLFLVLLSWDSSATYFDADYFQRGGGGGKKKLQLDKDAPL